MIPADYPEALQNLSETNSVRISLARSCFIASPSFDAVMIGSMFVFLDQEATPCWNFAMELDAALAFGADA